MKRQFKYLVATLCVNCFFLTACKPEPLTSDWRFNPDYVLGIYLFNLPIEEILFFICIPFSCVFTFHCLNLFFQIQWKPKTENIIVLCFAGILLITGLYFYSRLYSAFTFISLGILLLVLKYFAKINWLPKLFNIYLVLLIPFIIVNGILTGSGLENPVVWYNSSENLGIRIFTVPVEYIFYGFELIFLNNFLYEYFENKLNNSKVYYAEHDIY